MTTEERDQLVILNTKFDDLVTAIEKYEKSNQEQHKLILKKIDRNFDMVENKFTKTDDDCRNCKISLETDIKNKTNSGTFRWVVGGIAGLCLLGIVTIGGFMIDNRIQLSTLNNLMLDHIAYAALVYEDLTGETWGHASREALDEARKKVLEVRKERKIEQEKQKLKELEENNGE